MNWANCQQMMNKVVVREMDRMFFQPGLLREKDWKPVAFNLQKYYLMFLVVTLTAKICAKQIGKAKLSLKGGVHITRVHSPWL